jgi:hypothetical protein
LTILHTEIFCFHFQCGVDNLTHWNMLLPISLWSWQSYTLKLEAAYSSETLIPIYHPTRRHILTDVNCYCISFDGIREYFPQFFRCQNCPFASASRRGCAGTADTVYSHT